MGFLLLSEESGVKFRRGRLCILVPEGYFTRTHLLARVMILNKCSTNKTLLIPRLRSFWHLPVHKGKIEWSTNE